MMNEPFKQAKAIIETLKNAGYEAYFVGGSVRDYLLKRPVSDVDIATSAHPEDVIRLFKKTIPVGLEHGTVIVLHNETCYEVTTFRMEGEYKDFRHPSHVQFVSSLKQDLSRRDFTMNAIAMDENGGMFDPFCGIQDLKKKYIQTVGDPEERFNEDPLRIMRAIRFVSQLDFKLSEQVEQSIKKNAHLLTNISMERIAVEFDKLITGKANQKAVLLFIELNIYQYLPGFANKRTELMHYAKRCNQSQLTVDEQWTLLFYYLNIQEVVPFLKKWKSSKKEMKKRKLYLRAIYELKKLQTLTPMFVYSYTFDIVKSAMKVYCIVENKDYDPLEKQLTSIHVALPITERRQLAVSGQDLMEWFDKKGGPWLSEMIQVIEQKVVNGTIKNDKEDIREWLVTCNLPFEKNY